MLPSDVDITFDMPLVVSAEKLVTAADKPLSVDTGINDEAGSDCKGAESVTIAMAVVDIGWEMIKEDSILLLDG